MNKVTISACMASLLLLAACGGGGGETSGSGPDTSNYAKALVYQDPAATGFRLVRDSSSSDTHLVLKLLGPSGTLCKGVAFFVSTDASKVNWVHPTGAAGSHVSPGSVIALGTSPQFLTDKATGGVLQVALFQKGGSAATLGTAPLLSLALDLKGTTLPKGSVSLSLTSGKQAVMLAADGTLQPIAISLGSLDAQ